MAVLRIILTDQLTKEISSLEKLDKENDIIFMCESTEEFTHVKHHKLKIAFIISAMRHFAKELKDEGYNIIYKGLDNSENLVSFENEIQNILHDHNISKIIVTEPGEFRILENLRNYSANLNVPIEIIPDNRFLCSIEEFARFARDKKQLRMEYFYRYMRQKYSILIENEQPIGGKWNYDIENRKPPKEGLTIPSPQNFTPDEISRDVIEMVKNKFSSHFGDIDNFYFAVTRNQALIVLDKFIKERLHNFGSYQDAMIENEPWMYHSHISFYLNTGLLLPMECLKAAEEAFYDSKISLNAAEGFIRQILGWREYVRGIYWLKMPEYKNLNFLEAKRNLPNFYWGSNTKMNCIKQCVKQTKELSYAHHIQRLMVLGNFALISFIDPKFVNEWYLIVYADAFEWVELPNVTGMILFADGGYLGSKPYAGGGSYINKMSNYCKNCHYNVDEKNGSRACPFNYLYWNFLAENKDKLSSNQRLSMMYKTYDKMSDAKKLAIKDDSNRFLKMLDNNENV